LLVANSSALDELKLQRYKAPVRRVQGEIMDVTGAPLRLVEITVFNHPEVWANDSLTVRQKRAIQKKLASTSSDEDGSFSLKKLAEGSYEVEFSRSGFNTLSVIVQINSSAPSETFCIKLGVSDASDDSSFQPCAKEPSKHPSR
jgi:hypothetical protein